jgi:hypothetical protein
MIEILRLIVMLAGFFSDTFDVVVSCESTLGEDVLLAQQTFFLYLVLIVDPTKESWVIESSM